MLGKAENKPSSAQSNTERRLKTTSLSTLRNHNSPNPPLILRGGGEAGGVTINENLLITYRVLRQCLVSTGVYGRMAMPLNPIRRNGIQIALLFLFRHVLKQDFGEHKDIPRAKKSKYVPVVLSKQEIDTVLKQLKYPYDLAVNLLYG